jgi:hypothetical protein
MRHSRYLTCGFVAELLGLSIASWPTSLSGSRSGSHRGSPFVGPARLDLAGLERLAEAA